VEVLNYFHNPANDAKLFGVTARPSDDPTVAEFAGQLFFRLWRASHTRTAEALTSLDLTPALFALLNVLGARDGAIQQELSTLMGIDPSTMVSLIDELETNGFAARRRHPKDRRAWEVTITPAGRRALKRARAMAQQVEDDVLGGLSASERRRLMALLQRALDNAPAQTPWQAAEDEDHPRG
jgi:DNA-binding MarR family transcriptional regulator